MSERNGSTKSPAKAAARNVVDLAHDLVTLAELQAKLLQAETRQAVRGAVTPAVLLAVAALVAVGSVPVALLSLAYALVEFASWSQALSLLIAALVGAAVAGVATAIAIRKLRNNEFVLKRSRDELSRNAAWIKQVLRQETNQTQSDGNPRDSRRPTSGA